LGRVTGVILDDQFHFTAQQPPRLVGLLDEQANSFLEALTFVGVVTRQWSFKTNLDRASLPATAREHRSDQDDYDK
jgi:hypothetical protein